MFHVKLSYFSHLYSLLDIINLYKYFYLIYTCTITRQHGTVLILFTIIKQQLPNLILKILIVELVKSNFERQNNGLQTFSKTNRLSSQ